MRWEFHVEHEEPLSQTFDEFSGRFDSFLREALASGRWFVWVAEADKEIVSHIYVFVVPKVPRPSMASDAWGYVTNVYSEDSHRGHGVGSRLLQAVIEWALEQRLELLIVWPSEDSVAFYERAGFTANPEILERKLHE